MKTVSITVYNFEELSDSAKEKAREWYRNLPDSLWEEFTIEKMKTAAACLGISIEHIYYSGFWSQGDGACFTGTYRYCAGWKKAVIDEFGKDNEFSDKIISIGQNLQDLQAKYFYGITASIKHSGHYYHEFCTEIDVNVEHPGPGYYDNISDMQEGITEFLRDFMRLIYSELENEYNYQNSDECVDENIKANEYKFLENGEKFKYDFD